MARTELHGYVGRGPGKKDDYLTAFALNEWETQEWRQKIDTQKGACGGCVRGFFGLGFGFWGEGGGWQKGACVGGSGGFGGGMGCGCWDADAAHTYTPTHICSFSLSRCLCMHGCNG